MAQANSRSPARCLAAWRPGSTVLDCEHRSLIHRVLLVVEAYPCDRLFHSDHVSCHDLSVQLTGKTCKRTKQCLGASLEISYERCALYRSCEMLQWRTTRASEIWQSHCLGWEPVHQASQLPSPAARICAILHIEHIFPGFLVREPSSP